MKTHRPWQPRISSAPLFNPYAPSTGRDSPLDRFDLAEEEEVESSGDQLAADEPGGQPGDQPLPTKQD